MAVSEIVFGGTHAETFIISVLLQNANSTDTIPTSFGLVRYPITW